MPLPEPKLERNTMKENYEKPEIVSEEIFERTALGCKIGSSTTLVLGIPIVTVNDGGKEAAPACSTPYS